VRRELAKTVVNKGWGLLELRPMRMSLEEVFLQVTTDETASDPAAPAIPATDDSDGPAEVFQEAPRDERS
jgi:ABC-2 type transport system ATP-binding protein